MTAPLDKASARIAMISVPSAAATVLSDCFKQFRIQTVDVPAGDASRLMREKFAGCVIKLDEQTRAILETVRRSPSNRSLVIYAICDYPTAMKSSALGINAVLSEPVERNEALRAVRATYLLALHEFRRYVRIPVAIGVDVTYNSSSIQVLSQEVSSGGMSLHGGKIPADVQTVTVSFTLPGGKPTTLRTAVCWRRDSDTSFGIRFDVADPGRIAVRSWIEEFLDQQ